MRVSPSLLILLSCVCSVAGSGFLHNPRGSNNRLNSNDELVEQNRRLFDSQNGNYGGYNVCDRSNSGTRARGDSKCTDLPADETCADLPKAQKLRPSVIDLFGGLGAAGGNDTKANVHQMSMQYFEESLLEIQYTAQQGCGGNERDSPNKQNCNVVIEYMCDTDGVAPVDVPEFVDPAMAVNLADGIVTDSPKFSCANPEQSRTDNDASLVGRHESEAYACECTLRHRNKGLYGQDRIQTKSTTTNSAMHTYRNEVGYTAGLECAEEREYYPYWHPSPWRGIAYLTDAPDERCDFIQDNSVASRFKCASVVAGRATYSAPILAHTTRAACEAGGGQWLEYRAASTTPIDCTQAGYVPANNVHAFSTYQWQLPTFQSLVDSGVRVYTKPQEKTATGDTLDAASFAKCVMRLRYNITADEHDPWTSDATQPTAPQNPTINSGTCSLDIALNEPHRTFQDRTHVFYIRQRPTSLTARLQDKAATAASPPRLVHNLNAVGASGSIAHTFPRRTYDWAPRTLSVQKGDVVHLQWCGANSGKPRSMFSRDRHNLLQTASLSSPFPMPLDTLQTGGHSRLFGDGNQCFGAEAPSTPVSGDDCALRAATSGYYYGVSQVTAALSAEWHGNLHSAPASSHGGGQLLEINAQPKTTYSYMSTRNDGRADLYQRGTIVVVDDGAVVTKTKPRPPVTEVSVVRTFTDPGGLFHAEWSVDAEAHASFTISSALNGYVCIGFTKLGNDCHQEMDGWCGVIDGKGIGVVADSWSNSLVPPVRIVDKVNNVLPGATVTSNVQHASLNTPGTRASFKRPVATHDTRDHRLVGKQRCHWAVHTSMTVEHHARKGGSFDCDFTLPQTAIDIVNHRDSVGRPLDCNEVHECGGTTSHCEVRDGVVIGSCSEQAGTNESSNNIFMLVGIAGGAVLCVVLMALLAWVVRRRKGGGGAGGGAGRDKNDISFGTSLPKLRASLQADHMSPANVQMNNMGGGFQQQQQQQQQQSNMGMGMQQHVFDPYAVRM